MKYQFNKYICNELKLLALTKKSKAYKNILVIEDNHAILDVITLILQSEAYKVAGLNKSVDMMKHINEFQPDLMILDIMLPDGDGRELLSDIRNNSKTAAIPVLMISAKYTAKTIQHGEHKPNGFLAKPFDIDDLSEKVYKLLV